jgi:hypothetical protein
MIAYLAEGYLASATPEGLGAAQGRALTAAAELARRGIVVVYLEAVFLPPDQTCLTLFRAASAEHVTHLCRRAEIPCDRVTPAMLAEEPGRRHCGETGSGSDR